MRKNIIVITSLVCVVVTSFAQKHGQWTTPFSSNNVSKTYVDGKAVRDFNYHNPDLGRGSISVAYGFMPVTNMEWWSNPIVPSKLSKVEPLAGVYTSCIGALSASGNVYLNPWLELQVIFTYSHAEGTLSNTPDGTLSEDWFSLMPSIKVAWAQNDIVQIYSRVGAGIALVNRTEGIFRGHAIRANIAFAWQVSPVGVEVGRRVRFFAEAGFGQIGVVSAGVKFNFNSMTYNGAGSRKILPEYHWYDTYLNKK